MFCVYRSDSLADDPFVAKARLVHNIKVTDNFHFVSDEEGQSPEKEVG